MSQLNTAPEINPTIKDNKPNQVMLIKEPANQTSFIINDVKKEQDTNGFSIPQMDYIKFASKNRVLQNFIWSLTSSTTTDLVSIPITVPFLESLLPIGKDFNSFLNFDTVRFSIKPTSNAFMQGLLLCYWSNYHGPSSVYTEATNTDLRMLWQYPQKFFISPNTSDEYNFTIPINFPFNFMRWDTQTTTPDHSRAQANYVNNYIFGTLSFRVVVPLTTKSALTELNYSISAEMVGAQMSGIKFQ